MAQDRVEAVERALAILNCFSQEQNRLSLKQLAEQTGFSESDLELLWQSLMNMFDHDRSAARGEMSCRGLYVFKHDSKLGNAPAHTLFERITIAPGDQTPPRAFEDYKERISIDDSELPQGVTLIRLIG